MRDECIAYYRLIAGFLICLLAVGFSTGPAKASQDAGIVMQVSGTVTYSETGLKQVQKKVQAFMKFHTGDRIRMENDSKIELLFTTSGRRETWQGPEILMIESQKSSPSGKTAALSVETVPLSVAESIDQTPLPVPRAQVSRSGMITLRGDDGDKNISVLRGQLELGSQEKQDIKTAQEVYAKMKEKTGSGDLVPELYLLSVLSRYGQFREMEDLIKTMQIQAPDNSVVRRWRYMIAQNYPVRPEGFLLRADPACKKGQGCIELKGMGIFKKIGPFLFDNSNEVSARKGDILIFTLTSTAKSDHYTCLINIGTDGKQMILFPDLAGRSKGQIRAGESLDMFLEKGLGLSLELSGKESIRLFTGTRPVDQAYLSKSEGAGCKVDDDLRCLELVLNVK
ncbi:hypothetical protein QUF76_12685 [Desulfobacterales bacterium HSG16]|nr:hypothetical protein [Desulfobacterales bacterium HSG16]